MGRWAWIAVLALGLTVSFATMARGTSVWRALISVAYPDVRWVDGETLSNWMDASSGNELVLLDVRTPEEQRVSHLRDARLLNSKNPNIEALAIPESATVVVYCSIGYRSATVIEELEQAGFHDVYNLEGGLFEWANQDRLVFQGGEQVLQVHPFNRLWGLLLRRDLRAED
jgi:rhodanese-related sulfurtransferase